MFNWKKILNGYQHNLRLAAPAGSALRASLAKAVRSGGDGAVEPVVVLAEDADEAALVARRLLLGEGLARARVAGIWGACW